MFIKITKNKIQVDPVFNYEEIAKLVPLFANIAKFDIGNSCVDYTYEIIDGDLYAYYKSDDVEWFRFDVPTRHWDRLQ